MFEVTCLDSYGTTVTHLTQWDKGQSLIIKDTGLSFAPIFHFCNKNSDKALVVNSTIDDNGTITVKIPNSLLTESYAIVAYMYAYSSSDSAKTLATIKIPVRARVKPEEWEYAENSEDGISLKYLTKDEYDKLTVHKTKTLYFVSDNGKIEMYLGDTKLSAGTCTEDFLTYSSQGELSGESGELQQLDSSINLIDEGGTLNAG